MGKLKNTIASVLCSDLIGDGLAKIFNNKIPSWRYGRFTYDCSSEFILNSVKASLFWGIYESAEVRFVRNYLKKDLDVIELGASIGVVSTQILRKIEKEKKLIALEPNPYLVNTLKTNIEINCNNKYFEIINRAISYSDEAEVKLFLEKENVNSNLNKNSGKFVKISSIKLSDIILTKKISAYTLVCDIEGTEIEILLNDTSSLANCQQMIIELHDTVYNGFNYTELDLRTLIEQRIGMNCISNYGPVHIFER